MAGGMIAASRHGFASAIEARQVRNGAAGSVERGGVERGPNGDARIDETARQATVRRKMQTPVARNHVSKPSARP